MKTTLVLLALWLALMLAGSAVTPIQAATPNGCTLLGNAGNVLIMRCIDNETGNVVYANSAGFMVVAQ